MPSPLYDLVVFLRRLKPPPSRPRGQRLRVPDPKHTKAVHKKAAPPKRTSSFEARKVTQVKHQQKGCFILVSLAAQTLTPAYRPDSCLLLHIIFPCLHSKGWPAVTCLAATGSLSPGKGSEGL